MMTVIIWRWRQAARWPLVFSMLLGSWLFLVFPTEPLYIDNQNTKFLHGMALAGIGHLAQDWTANTRDVMPVFSMIVYALHVVLPAWSAYVVQIALFGIFLIAMIGIARQATPSCRHDPLFTLVIAALCVALQSTQGGARVFAGVAKQYLLGEGLEPQSFGVLFVLAILVFLHRKIHLALALAVLPAIIHPGYVVPAITMILGFWLSAGRHVAGDRRPRLSVVVLALAVSAASLIYLGWMILPTDGESFARANDILARIRIPDHALPARWLDADAAAKFFGVCIALFLLKKQRLFFELIAFCLVAILLLTMLSILLDSNEIGMVSPWRISVYLVPACLAVLLGRLVGAVLKSQDRPGGFHAVVIKAAGAALLLSTLAATSYGLVRSIETYGRARTPDHVLFMRKSGDASTQYLTDPDDMNIRLQSGLPQMVSWKTHPYRDVEVLAWYERLILARRVFQGETIDCAALDEAIARYDVTHLLIETPARRVPCPLGTPLFEDEHAIIFELAPDAKLSPR